MKQLLVCLGILSAVLTFSGCDKPDYQHPSHRSGK